VAAFESSRSHAWRSVDTAHVRPLQIAGDRPLPANLLLTPR
jgi:hypothetical protein